MWCWERVGRGFGAACPWRKRRVFPAAGWWEPSVHGATPPALLCTAFPPHRGSDSSPRTSLAFACCQVCLRWSSPHPASRKRLRPASACPVGFCAAWRGTAKDDDDTDALEMIATRVLGPGTEPHSAGEDMAAVTEAVRGRTVYTGHATRELAGPPVPCSDHAASLA